MYYIYLFSFSIHACFFPNIEFNLATCDFVLVITVFNIFTKAHFPEQTRNIRPVGEQLVFNCDSFSSS